VQGVEDQAGDRGGLDLLVQVPPGLIDTEPGRVHGRPGRQNPVHAVGELPGGQLGLVFPDHGLAPGVFGAGVVEFLLGDGGRGEQRFPALPLQFGQGQLRPGPRQGGRDLVDLLGP
jgi:hypothetical protein